MVSKIKFIKQKESINNIKNIDSRQTIADQYLCNKRKKDSKKCIKMKNIYHDQITLRGNFRKVYNGKKLMLFLFIFFAASLSQTPICKKKAMNFLNNDNY